MQNLAGRFHIFEGPALKPHAAVGEIVMQPDKLAVLPKFRNKIAVLRVGLELHAVAYRLLAGLGASSVMGCSVSCLFPEPKKAAGQQQAQGESHCIRTDRPIPENRTDSLAAP